MESKEEVEERRGTLAERIRERWQAFRSRSVYFQLKALVVVSYVAIVVATLVWAPPSSQAKNQIGARVMVLEGDMVVGPYFIIENDSGSHWQHVTFAIDDGYAVERDLVLDGEKVTLFVKDFKKTVVRHRRGRDIPKRVRAPVDLPLTELIIHCSEGDLVEPITLGASPSPGEANLE